MEVVQRVRVTCPRCAAPVAGDFKFCPTCAYRLKAGLAAAEPSEAPRRRLAALAMIVLAALFVGLFTGVGFWLFRDRPPKPTPAPLPSGLPALGVEDLTSATVRKYLVHVPNGTAYMSEPTEDLGSLPLYVGDLDVLRYEVPVSFYAEFARDLAERVKRKEKPCPTLQRLWNATTPQEVEYAQRYLYNWIESYLQNQGVKVTVDTPPPPALVLFAPEERRLEASAKTWTLAQAITFPWPDDLCLLLMVPPSWATGNPWDQMTWAVPPGTAALPVSEITWFDAVGFTEWLSEVSGPDVTFRLPVAAEWTRIAHGDLPPEDWLYPWGSKELYAACNNLDLYPENVDAILQPVAQKYFGRDGDKVYDGSTLEGVYSMAGNVAEWVLTGGSKVQRVNDALRVYYDAEEDRNVSEAYAYGGSFRHRLIECTVQSSLRNRKYLRSPNIGFRFVFQPRF